MSREYTDTHEWIEFISEGTARIGLTDYAQKALGELVFVNLPEPGDSLTAGESLGDVESVKSVSDIISPVSGKVKAINEALLDSPELINNAPYEAWLVEADVDGGCVELMDAGEYEDFCGKE